MGNMLYVFGARLWHHTYIYIYYMLYMYICIFLFNYQGLIYIFFDYQTKFGRIFWSTVVFSMIFLGLCWCTSSYLDWQNNPGLTTITTTALPVNSVITFLKYITKKFLIQFIYFNVVKTHRASNVKKIYWVGG